MITMKPFMALRPAEDYAEKLAALPYDVMNSSEAREMAAGNPYSFLRIDKAEIDLDPSVHLYDPSVYEKARENLLKFEADGVFKQDAGEYFYIYSQTMDGRTQYGIVGCPSIDDYMEDRIKKHEFTRADKEEDRIRHVDVTDANTGPIFLAHRENKPLKALVSAWVEAHSPACDFTAEDGIGHTVWVIDDASVISEISEIFAGMDALYIADGHHRCASAVKVGLRRREANPGYTGKEEFNFFLAVVFPEDELKIFDYNRLVADLNGLSEDAFFEKLRQSFDVSEYTGEGQMRPSEKHTFGMYLQKKWYVLKALAGTFDENDPVGRLDVSILQERLLSPILGIEDPRTDKRIDFVGGIRGLLELENRVDAGMAVAFSLFPTTMEDLMAISDAGAVMPPKSTWFEPKLRSGMFVHKLS